MILSIAVVLGVLCILAIVVPFLRRSDEELPSTDSEILAVRDNRDALYQSLDTLELEFKLGHVDARFYNEMLSEYRKDAAINLRTQEVLENQLIRLEQGIEVEIEQLAQTSESDLVSCPECHHPLDPIGQICDQCGFGDPGNHNGPTDIRSRS